MMLRARSSDRPRRPRPRAWVLLRTIKRIRAPDGCLGVERRRRTWHAAIRSGEARAPFDPDISEWGNPPLRPSTSGVGFGRRRVWLVVQRYSPAEYIGWIKRTRGTETSQYPEERTSTETPVVVASEPGPGQCRREIKPNDLERSAIA